MTSSISIPDNAKAIFLADLIGDVQQRVDEADIQPFDALAYYSMELYGLSDEDGARRSDGAGDRGIDWYRVEQNTADIWQFKGVNELTQEKLLAKASGKDLLDLRRIIDYIQTIHQYKHSQNKHVRAFQSSVSIKLESIKNDEIETFYFNVNYFIAKSKLTSEAESELKEIQLSSKSIKTISDVPVEVSIKIFLIDDLLEERWRQDNASWKSIGGNKEDWVEISIDGHMIDDQKSQILFGRAFDLIEAYNRLGQRLFAPNVRCYLKDTPVNSHIREAVKTRKGIDNFKYMNNGITIIADNVDKKKGSSRIRLHRPGIVNGLQTIRSLFEAYSHMDEADRNYFMDNCYVLTRVFGAQKPPFLIEDLIIATNNQNKMEARNLKSNTNTQKIIENSFAKLGWFYERKEKAWEAFAESDGRWDTLRGKKPSHFGGNTKPRRRNLDNSLVATSFLAFSGYSDTARNRKSAIFSDERLYRRIFESEARYHGYDYNFGDAGDREESTYNSIPPASVLLLASLVYQTIKQTTPSTSQIREKFSKRLGIEWEPFEKQHSILLEHPSYLANLMLCSSPFLFTEVYGYLFYSIPMDERPYAAEIILKNTDLKPVFEQKEYSKLSDAIEGFPGANDFFVAVYHLLSFILSELADSESFRRDLIGASSRPSFLHGTTTRRRIFERIRELDQHIDRQGSLLKGWSAPFDKRGGIIGSMGKFVSEDR